MFALEAMALEKPVLCFLRPDLLEFYIAADLLEPGEIPIINCSPATVKDTLRQLVQYPERLAGWCPVPSICAAPPLDHSGGRCIRPYQPLAGRAPIGILGNRR